MRLLTKMHQSDYIDSGIFPLTGACAFIVACGRERHRPPPLTLIKTAPGRAQLQGLSSLVLGASSLVMCVCLIHIENDLSLFHSMVTISGV